MSDFKWVRSIFGKGENAKQQYHYLPEGGMNKIIEEWHKKQTDRPMEYASPSRLTTCPRVVWLANKGVEPINTMTWAVKQRMLLGRLFENQFALQLKDEGKLHYHWADDIEDAEQKFSMGEGETYLAGVPDYVIDIDGVSTMSDAKTSRSDSFGYLPIDETIFDEGSWYKYRVQLTAYLMLCEMNPEWFKKNDVPMPTQCHLFSYALDDGLVRREFIWTPTKADRIEVLQLTKRFNRAVDAQAMPMCTCRESKDMFDVKFCSYGVVPEESKVATECCDESLKEKVPMEQK